MIAIICLLAEIAFCLGVNKWLICSMTLLGIFNELFKITARFFSVCKEDDMDG